MSFRHLKTIAIPPSERVKCVELHPTEPMLVVALFDGNVQIYNTNDWTILRTIHVSPTKPVRCVRWMTSINAVITSGDDLSISAYDYNTGTLIATQKDAHADYIRSIAVHPSQPLILSASDDTKIKLFRIENNSFKEEHEYTGHKHFVMDVKFNPKDPNQFASASLDNTIKFWGINESAPRFTLSGHIAGVNCIEFCPSADKTILVSGSDDFTIRFWNLQNNKEIHRLASNNPNDTNFHTGNVTSLRFHPKFPLLFSTGEDNKFFIWNTTTYKREMSFNTNKGRGWTIDSNDTTIALGCDEGLSIMQFENTTALVSTDTQGRTYWALNNEIKYTNLAQGKNPEDGKLVDLKIEDRATVDFYPAYTSINPSEKNVALCGEGNYYIYSMIGFRVKESGSANEFAWGSGDYFATRLGKQVTIHKLKGNPQKLTHGVNVTSIFGGHLLGLASNESIFFYDWQFLNLIRQIDVKATNVWWCGANKVAIATDDTLYVLVYTQPKKEDDYENAFFVESQIEVSVKSGCWYENAFFYSDGRSVSFIMEDRSEVIARFDKPYQISGYAKNTERIYLYDRDVNFISYSVPISLLKAYKKVLRFDEEEENEEEEEENLDIDETAIPSNWLLRFTSLLEEKGQFRRALKFAETDDKIFELALKIPDFNLAISIARKTKSLVQWHQISTIALKEGQIDLLEEALKVSGDENGLLLLHSACKRKKQMKELAESVSNAKNVSFAAYFSLGEYSKCIDILLETGREPEAALMARTYLPRRINECVELWQKKLRERGDHRLADSIASPKEYPNLFGIEDQQQEEEEKKVEIPKVDSKKEEAKEEKVEEEEEELDVDDLLAGIDTGAEEDI